VLNSPIRACSNYEAFSYIVEAASLVEGVTERPSDSARHVTELRDHIPSSIIDIPPGSTLTAATINTAGAIPGILPAESSI
jgi:hypothetical protein